jgi:hypothetical protein
LARLDDSRVFHASVSRTTRPSIDANGDLLKKSDAPNHTRKDRGHVSNDATHIGWLDPTLATPIVRQPPSTASSFGESTRPSNPLSIAEEDVSARGISNESPMGVETYGNGARAKERKASRLVAHG